jgi:hypothetical protein
MPFRRDAYIPQALPAAPSRMKACIECGAEFLSRGWNHVRCRVCQEARDAKNQAKAMKRMKERRAKAKAASLAASAVPQAADLSTVGTMTRESS